MAERTKRQSSPPKRVVNKYLQVYEAKNKKKKAGKDNQLYEIEKMEVEKRKKRKFTTKVSARRWMSGMNTKTRITFSHLRG